MPRKRPEEQSLVGATRTAAESSPPIGRRTLLLSLGGAVASATVLPTLNSAQAKSFQALGTAKLSGAANATLGIGKGKNDKSFIVWIDRAPGIADSVRTVSFSVIDQDFGPVLTNGGSTNGTIKAGGRSTAWTAVGRKAGKTTTINLTVGNQQGTITTQVDPGTVAIVGIIAVALVAIVAIVAEVAKAEIEAQNEGGTCDVESDRAEGFISEPICDELGLQC